MSAPDHSALIERDDFQTMHEVTPDPAYRCTAFECNAVATRQSHHKDPACWAVGFWCDTHGVLSHGVSADQLADIRSVTETPDDARRIAGNVRALAARPAYRAPGVVQTVPAGSHETDTLSIKMRIKALNQDRPEMAPWTYEPFSQGAIERCVADTVDRGMRLERAGKVFPDD